MPKVKSSSGGMVTVNLFGVADVVKMLTDKQRKILTQVDKSLV